MPYRILFAAPGVYLWPECGPTHTVLHVCREMNRWAETTAAFRGVIRPPDNSPCPVLALEPDRPAPPPTGHSDNALRGGALSLARYLTVLRRFAERHRADFDCVIEYGWRGSGLLSSPFQAYGVPVLAAEHFPRLLEFSTARDIRSVLRRPIMQFTEALVMRWLRRADAVLAETPTLARDLVRRVRVDARRVHTVGLGVDTQAFFPRDRAECRRRLGLPDDGQLWLYIGGLGLSHDLKPCLRAFATVRPAGVRVLVVGDGPDAAASRRAAGQCLGRTVTFIGCVPYEAVPLYVGAADLGLVPYVADIFPRRQITAASLKLHQYMAGGRPAAAVPSGEVLRLVRHGDNGLLVENSYEAWLRFCAAPPDGARLAEMGARARQAVQGRTWADVARRHLDVCRLVCEQALTGTAQR